MPALRIALVVAFAVAVDAHAFGRRDGGDVPDLNRLNRQLNGRVDDHSANHGADRRLVSAALGQKRDAYVYVPPGYDPAKRYPLVVWLHGLAQDETSFLTVVATLDRHIASGRLPKCVIVAPDGTARGRASLKEPPSLYLNSPLGRFEDYIVYDVWNLATANYSIRPERQAHVLAGASMGAFGAYNLGIKHRQDYAVVAGVLPPLNLRYADRRGRTDGDFDGSTIRFTDRYEPNATVARFGPMGIVAVKQRQIIAPVFGEWGDVSSRVAAESPAEMLAAKDVKPGDLAMFVGYGDRDEFNFDAHAESFTALARGRGLDVHLVRVPGGRHDRDTAARMIPDFVDWLKPQIAAYAPE